MSTFMFFKHQTLYYDRVELEIEKAAIEQTIYGTRYQEIRDEINELNKEINELNTIDISLFSVNDTFNDIFNDRR